MTNQQTSSRQLAKIGGVAGILSIIFYFSVAVLSIMPDALELGIAFTFPLLWIIAFMGLYQFLKTERPSASLEIAYLFGVIGAAVALVFLVVQQANFIWHDQAMAEAATEEGKALLKAAFRGANRVQAGMDVAFDIFITVSWFLFGVAIARSRYFNKILGWVGCLLSAGLLTLNMITFPTAPAEAGLFDLGPFLGIWTLVVYIWFTRVAFKKQPSKAGPDHSG